MNIWPTPFFIISCHGSVKLKRLGPEALHNTLKLVASVALVSKILHTPCWASRHWMLGSLETSFAVQRKHIWRIAMSWCWSFWILTHQKKVETTHCIESLMAVHWDMKLGHQRSQQYMASLLLFHLPLGAIDLTDANQLHSTIPHNPLMSTGHLDSERLTGLARPASNNESIFSQPLREVSYIILWVIEIPTKSRLTLASPLLTSHAKNLRRFKKVSRITSMWKLQFAWIDINIMIYLWFNMIQWFNHQVYIWK